MKKSEFLGFIFLVVGLGFVVSATLSGKYELIITGITILISILTVYIAYQQYEGRKYQTRLSLYDRRYEIYAELSKLLSKTIASGYADREDIEEFWRKTKHAEFLFDSDVNSYIEEFYKKSLELAGYADSLKQNDLNTEKRKELVDKKHLAFHWFHEQLIISIDKFKAYMDLGKVK